ncbi:MAG: hypothetical protein ABR898_03795 [Terracidiphilus sp.]
MNTNAGSGAPESIDMPSPGVSSFADIALNLNYTNASGGPSFSALGATASSPNGWNTVFYKFALHELLHALGLADTSKTSPQNIMNGFNSLNDMNNSLGDASNPSNLLTNGVLSQVQAALTCITQPAPTTSDTTSQIVWLGQQEQQQPPACIIGDVNNCSLCVPPPCYGTEDWNPVYCECYTYPSPIVIDTDGTGFHLTSAANGVLFDFFGTGHPIQVAWTEQGSTNGWLALDRNGDGIINSAKELFGNITEQPPSRHPNGFLALAVFDEPENGGNGDGIIDSRDAVWPKLLVWIDSNHDGISQPDELHHLDDIGIHSIALSYRESRFKDAFGNQFRYRGTVNPDKGDAVGRVIYDVFLTDLRTQAASLRPKGDLELVSHSLATPSPESPGRGLTFAPVRHQACASSQPPSGPDLGTTGYASR